MDLNELKKRVENNTNNLYRVDAFLSTIMSSLVGEEGELTGKTEDMPIKAGYLSEMEYLLDKEFGASNTILNKVDRLSEILFNTNSKLEKN